jgi:hypothetical protein
VLPDLPRWPSGKITFGKRGLCRLVVSAHDQSDAQAVSGHAMGVDPKRAVNLKRGISPMREHELERIFATRPKSAVAEAATGSNRESEPL